ncbi:MAG: hypothetical protein QNJ98_11110 [Planctomycetota bacterium]|nr:hypothetical protein [Planctomycetota bacterium]
MIRPLRGSELSRVLRRYDNRARPFPILDRAFDAVERALAQLGIEAPDTLRSPRPVEDALSPTALPEGTLLVLDPREIRAAEIDVEETVKDERQGGSIFLTLPNPEDLPGRARGLRELATAAQTFGFHGGTRPRIPSRLGKTTLLPLPTELDGYRFLLADTPGFRVCVVQRALPGGGWIALWSGNDLVLDELRTVLALEAAAAGHNVPLPSPEVPSLDGIESENDVWAQARDLRDYRVVRQAELREIARQAALRGVALRREREAKRQAEAQRATGS